MLFACFKLVTWNTGEFNASGDDVRSCHDDCGRRYGRPTIGLRIEPRIKSPRARGCGGAPAIFAHACKLGCEGIVSKRRDLPYRSGRAKSWLKIKNRKSPVMLRIEERAF